MPEPRAPKTAGEPAGPCPSDHLLSAYLDHELTAGARASFEAHLASCSSCAGALLETRRLSALFAASASPMASPRLIGRLRDIPRAERERALARTAFALTSIAAALLMAGSAWLWLNGPATRSAADWELVAVASDGPPLEADDRDLQLAAWVVSDLSRESRR